MRSCKSAVKGGDRLSEEEAAALIKDLKRCINPFSCPHGRHIHKNCPNTKLKGCLNEPDEQTVVIAGPTAVENQIRHRSCKSPGRGDNFCDSMQLYRYMDIGSAKPTPEEMAQAVHHLVDVIDPSQPFSPPCIRRWQREAYRRGLFAWKTSHNIRWDRAISEHTDI